jgi:perosamine synthetase
VIPFFEPDVGEDEIAAVAEAIRRGELSGSFGRSIPEFEAALASYCGVKHGVAVSSGTAALHLAVAAAEIGPGDEILMSSSTNIATALAAYHNGAISVPVDAEEETWNINIELIEDLVSPRTKAIIPVHLYGHPVDMDRVMEIARRHGLLVIEDCAESPGATCRGRQTGSFGDMACFSFYANKVITTGEGGMVLTDNDALAEKLRLLRNLAFTQPRFWHELPGFNFRMTGYQAAMGLTQCRRITGIIENKRRVAHTYNRLLANIPGLHLPHEAEWARSVYWMYAVVVERSAGHTRANVLDALQSDGIETRTFFCPMNQQPFLRKQPGYRDIPCPVADRLWEDGFYLPSSPLLSDSQMMQVATSLRRALA